MLISLITTRQRYLENLSSVVLSDADATYGVRRVSTGEVVVPAGTPFVNLQAGVYTYEADVSEDDLYECAITAVGAVGTTYMTFRKYVPATPADLPAESESDSTSDSASSSTSESESEASGRSIKLDRSPLEQYPIDGRSDMFRLVITASEANLMPVDVFTFQKRPVDVRSQDAPIDFMFVATPFDATIYPAGNPDTKQRPGFYRKSEVEFIVASTEAAEYVWAAIKAEVNGLKAAYDRLDYLSIVEEVVVDGSGEFAPITVEVEVATCGEATISDDDESETVAVELNEAVGLTMLEHG